MAIGLYNAGSIILCEKGFYGMAFVLSIFAAITIQKNIREELLFNKDLPLSSAKGRVYLGTRLFNLYS